MSLFIGVISMNMFEAFDKLKAEKAEREYKLKLAHNAKSALEGNLEGEDTPLTMKIKQAFADKPVAFLSPSPNDTITCDL